MGCLVKPFAIAILVVFVMLPLSALAQAFYAARFLNDVSPDATILIYASQYDVNSDGTLATGEMDSWIGAATTQSTTRGGTMLLDIPPAERTTGITIPHGWILDCADSRARTTANGGDLEFDLTTAGAQVAVTMDDHSGLTNCTINVSDTDDAGDTGLSMSGASNAMVSNVHVRNQAGALACAAGSAGATACVTTFGRGLEWEGTQKSVVLDMILEGFYELMVVERVDLDQGSNHSQLIQVHFQNGRYGIHLGGNSYTSNLGDFSFLGLTFENSVHRCLWADTDEEGATVAIYGAHFECGTGASNAGRSIYSVDPDLNLSCSRCTMTGQTTQDVEIDDANRITFYSPWFQDDAQNEFDIAAACQGYSTDGCKVDVFAPNLTPDVTGNTAGNYEVH